MNGTGHDFQPLPFRDRTDAGRYLATKLDAYRGRPDLLVLALPRGGVPVGFEVALALHAPLDVFIVRKLGLPGHEELAIGAIASGGAKVLDDYLIRELNLSPGVIASVIAQEERELERREREYRGDHPPVPVAGHTVILVDDGLATGYTMRAAVTALKQEGAAQIVVAVPVAPPDTCDSLRAEVDAVVCAATPEPFVAVGLWYRDFRQTTDEEARELLARAASLSAGWRSDRPGSEVFPEP
jgi:putative phosphoribosyl transferase